MMKFDGFTLFKFPQGMTVDELAKQTDWVMRGNFFFHNLPREAMVAFTTPIAVLLSKELQLLMVDSNSPGAMKKAREIFHEAHIHYESIVENLPPGYKPNAGRDDDNYDMTNTVLRHGGAGTKVSPRTDRVHGHPLAEHQAMVASGSNDFVRGENC